MRTGFLGLALAMSCAAAPAPQAGGEGEALFRKMEQALATAKKLHVEFESTADGAGVKGTIRIDEGNKLELKVEGTSGAKKYELVLACDGQKMTLERKESPPPAVPGKPQPELPAPANLAANVAGALARGGSWLAQEFADGEYRRAADPWFIEHQDAELQHRPMNAVPAPAPRDVAALHVLANFRAGKAEAGNPSVAYDLVSKDPGPTLLSTVTVWIDSKTNLPARREGAFYNLVDGKPSGPPLSKWTETYRFKP